MYISISYMSSGLPQFMKQLITKLIRAWYFIQIINCVSDILQIRTENDSKQQRRLLCVWILFYEKSKIGNLKHI